MATSVAVSIAALIAIFGEMDETTWITVVFTLIGLIPWVLEASGVRLHPMLFLVMAMLPVSAVVLVDRNPGGLFPAYIAVVWITQRATSRIAVVVSLLATAGLTVGQGIVQTAEFEGTVYFLGGVGIALFAGLLLRRQERLLTELQQATERERVHAAVEEPAAALTPSPAQGRCGGGAGWGPAAGPAAAPGRGSGGRGRSPAHGPAAAAPGPGAVAGDQWRQGELQRQRPGPS